MRPVTAVLLVFIAASPASLAAQSFDFYARGPYRPAVPRPEAITGREAGTWHTSYGTLQRYLDTLIAAAGDRVRVELWGETAEHRPIRVLIISDPANLARLDQIRAGLAELTDPRRTSPGRAAEIAERSPAVAVFHYSVHGNEPAGFEASMQVAYQLLASDEPKTLEILKNVVVVLNPSANPDGHERFAVWYNSVALGADHPSAFEQSEPWSVTGRFNHFRFDMNRDLVAQSQPEVRAMMDGVRRWHPQVFVDHHSTTPNYFFPPVAEAINRNLPAQTTKWFETYGRGNAAAFDRYGWQYFVGGVFDFFYVGYWDEWTTFQGATGMTYETDGGPEFNKRRDDGTVTTFRDGIAHHFVASLATLETTAQHRKSRLVDFYEFRRSAIAEAATDRMKRVVFVPGADERAATRVVGLLLRHGIEVTRLAQPVTSRTAHSYLGGPASTQTFPAGSYVIDLNQPQRRLAKALLESHAQPSPSFVQRELEKFQRNRRRGQDAEKEDYGFYDITAWSLPLSFNLDAYWTEDGGPAGQPVTDAALALPPAPPRAATAYVFRNDNLGAARLALALSNEGYRLGIAAQPLRADGKSYPRGTFVVRLQRNAPTVHDRIAALAPASGAAVTAVQSAFPDTGDAGIGSSDVVALFAPKILVAAGDGVFETSYGWLWHFLSNDLGATFTPVRLRSLSGMTDLPSYNVFIIPDGNAARMRRELGEGGTAALKAWVQSGGVLIGVGGAGDLAAHKDVGLSTVTAVGADSAAKPDTTAPGNTPPLVSPSAAPKDRPEWIPGAIFRATLDRTHWLTMGYEGERLPVFLEGETFWKPSKGGANPVTFTGDSLLLSGFTWPGNTERLLKGTSWVVVENQGSGRVVLFLGEPLFRAFWLGTARLVTNAILIGPTR